MWRPGLPKIARQGRGGATAQRAFGLHEGRATRLSGWRVTTTWALCGESRAPAAEGANAVHHAQGPLLWAQSARWLRKGAGHQALADVFLTLTGRLAAAEGENKNSEPSLPFCSATGNPKFLKPIRFCSKTQDARAPPHAPLLHGRGCRGQLVGALGPRLLSPRRAGAQEAGPGHRAPASTRCSGGGAHTGVRSSLASSPGWRAAQTPWSPCLRSQSDELLQNSASF